MAQAPNPETAWPSDESDLEAMDAATRHVMWLVCEARIAPPQGGQPSPELDVSFHDPRTVVVYHESEHEGIARVWVHRLGAPPGSQMNEPAIMEL